MRVVTKITQQKRQVDRYNIFLNNVYSFSVSEQVLVQYGIKKGMELTEEQLDDLIRAESFQKSYLLAIRYLGFRMRTEKEMRGYLTKKEIGLDVINKIIDQLIEKKYINDEQFAIAFVKDRMNQTSKGPNVIRRELAEKGIKNAIIEQVIKIYRYEDEYEIALQWASKQMNRQSKHSYRKRLEQLKVRLIQKGFSREVIHDVFEHIETEPDESEERTALHYHGDKLFRRHSKKHDGYELVEKVKVGLYRLGFRRELIDEYIAKINE